MQALLDEVSVGLIDEFCVLCNVWLAGNVAQHTHGKKHVKWNETAQAVFRQTAPAACVLVAALLCHELECEVRDHYCLCCRQHVGEKFFQAIQHLNSSGHRRKKESPALFVSTVIREGLPHGDGFVQDIFCSICLCVVPMQQEKHRLSKRHQRNLRVATSSASQMEAAKVRREMWTELLQPMHGNVCCSCAEYVAVEDIMQHFTSAQHKKAHAAAQGTKHKEGMTSLRSLLESAKEYTADGYCSVCDVTVRSSMRAHHTQGKRHNMELLRAHCEPNRQLRLWKERFNIAVEKKRERLVNADKKASTVEVPSDPLDALISHDTHVDKTPGTYQSQASESFPLVDTPLLFFFLKGCCILCNCSVAPQSTRLVATPVCKEHCLSSRHQEALRDFVFLQRKVELEDAATAWAARWYAAAFGVLREECACWRECAEGLGLHTHDDFLKLLEDNFRIDAFLEAVCALRPAQ
ncbi:hypothetical protein TraAM80_01748 [Trypanosoma rangeli]|uniref:U1-type domain-containing protein n=1 Tax=Trypanosoma rangeli TaxID=5698 RepID=A0A422NXK9_TRYRA|nr:uncharacterized protein TraAM80_01748 [Trypanosoma rangeli]RNF10171.1 hypothetical protein TraAM80_01748 [Trypanosoma rangeli]|eukprot:RNF10171.1 hypothetical protein TraAM80_01748 [Trypanosoma rangeli]